MISSFYYILCRYTEYEFYGDVGVAQSAQTHTRYSLNSLFGVAFDVYMLADSEYLVCTFSSQVSLYLYHVLINLFYHLCTLGLPQYLLLFSFLHELMAQV